MVGRFTTRSTMTRFMVWLLLIAFSICLTASTAFSRQRPYDIKTVTHVVKGEKDDGGWIDPTIHASKPPNENGERTNRLFLNRFLYTIWESFQAMLQHANDSKIVNESEENANSGSSAASASE